MSKVPKVPKEPKAPKAPKAPKEPKAQKVIKSTKEPKEPVEPKMPKLLLNIPTKNDSSLKLTFPNNIKFVCHSCNDLIDNLNKNLYKMNYYCNHCYIYITLN